MICTRSSFTINYLYQVICLPLAMRTRNYYGAQAEERNQSAWVLGISVHVECKTKFWKQNQSLFLKQTEKTEYFFSQAMDHMQSCLPCVSADKGSSLNGAAEIHTWQWIMWFPCSQSLDFTPTQILSKSPHISIESWTDLHLTVLFCIAAFPFFQSKNQFEKNIFSSKSKELKLY